MKPGRFLMWLEATAALLNLAAGVVRILMPYSGINIALAAVFFGIAWFWGVRTWRNWRNWRQGRERAKESGAC